MHHIEVITVVCDTAEVVPFLLVVCRICGLEQVLTKCSNRLIWVHWCCMSGTALWSGTRELPNANFSAGHGQIVLAFFKWNSSVKQSMVTSHAPADPACRFGLSSHSWFSVCRECDRKGLIREGLQPKLISHVDPSAWITDRKVTDKTGNFLCHFSFHLF